MRDLFLLRRIVKMAAATGRRRIVQAVGNFILLAIGVASVLFVK